MKTIKSLIITCCIAVALPSFMAGAAEDDKHKGCCPATIEGQKKCKHECCKKAAEEGKICPKCHKQEQKA